MSNKLFLAENITSEIMQVTIHRHLANTDRNLTMIKNASISVYFGEDPDSTQSSTKGVLFDRINSHITIGYHNQGYQAGLMKQISPSSTIISKRWLGNNIMIGFMRLRNFSTYGKHQLGRLKGPGIKEYSTGEMEGGIFKNGLLNGPGVITIDPKTSINGIFKEGEIEGPIEIKAGSALVTCHRR